MRHKRAERIVLCLCLFVAVFVVFAAQYVWGNKNLPVFDVITIDSAITPAVSKYVLKSIEQSHSDGSDGLIILIDTPGGLDSAMRDIIKELLDPPIPVIVFVYPSGARAASAGVLITMAAPIATMAPGTNIGAAHPVSIGLGGKADKTMMEKVENDAVAYARGIAKKMKRNEEWVEKAVKKSESITAEEALKLNVIDFMADDIEDLLGKIDGRVVMLKSGETVVGTKGAIVNVKKMGLRDKILITLSDPNIAYLLMMIGLAGLYFEFAHPGAILPGVVGGISLLLAFFALQTLSVNYVGVLLIIFGIILFIAEIKIVSHGMLTVAGIISLVLGSIMLFESPVPGLGLSFKVMIPTIVFISLFFIAVIGLAVKAQMGKVKTGLKGMIGLKGVTIGPVHASGKVFVRGEYWNASSRESLEEGEHIKVTGISGLNLEVERFEDQKGG